MNSGDHVYIDLNGPNAIDDHRDAVYEYTPPTLVSHIFKLSADHPPGSVKTLSLSVPKRPRSASAVQAIEALCQFLQDPVCSGLESLQVSGSAYLLNDKHLLDITEAIKLNKLSYQSGSSTLDSYSLAALLCASQGITSMRLDLPPADRIHQSFLQETWNTFSQVTDLNIILRGDDPVALTSILPPTSLENVQSFSLSFESRRWPHQATSALLAGSSSFSKLKSLNITKLVSDVNVLKACDATSLRPLLATSQALQKIRITSSSSQEPLILTPDLVDILPQSLQLLELRYAGPPHLTELYSPLRVAVPHQLQKLRMVSLSHAYPLHEATESSEGWEFVRTASGHPTAIKNAASTAMTRLANELEANAIPYRISLCDEDGAEERRSSL